MKFSIKNVLMIAAIALVAVKVAPMVPGLNKVV